MVAKRIGRLALAPIEIIVEPKLLAKREAGFNAPCLLSLPPPDRVRFLANARPVGEVDRDNAILVGNDEMKRRDEEVVEPGEIQAIG